MYYGMDFSLIQDEQPSPQSYSISNKTLKYPPHFHNSKKRNDLSPARARDISNKTFTILTALNNPERIANELQGLFNIDPYALMNEYGYGDGNLQEFFAKFGYKFDDNGCFILPLEPPNPDIPNKDILYTDDELSSPPLPRSDCATIWKKPPPPPRLIFEGFSNNNNNKIKRSQTFCL